MVDALPFWSMSLPEKCSFGDWCEIDVAPMLGTSTALGVLAVAPCVSICMEFIGWYCSHGTICSEFLERRLLNRVVCASIVLILFNQKWSSNTWDKKNREIRV